MNRHSLLRGAMWGTLAVFLSKVLGFIYLIPFNSILDVDQQIVFTSAYRIYAYVLLIATAGIPFATANMIAKYNSHKNYYISFKLLFSNIFLMLTIGIICFIGMFVLAKPLALLIITKDTSPEIINNVMVGIRVIALALIFVPMISVIRGFFQGYKEIQISSISQLVEQFINSLFILAALLLAGSGIISNLFAVYFATFCATLGSVASLFYLKGKYNQLKPMFRKYYLEGRALNSNKDINTKSLYKELLAISIPYVAVVLLAQSNDLIDLMYTIRGLLEHGYSINEAKQFSTIYGMSVNKLLTIPMTISTGLSVALVPHLAEAYAQRDRNKIQNLVSKILEGTVVVLIPIVSIMMALGYEIFIVIGSGRSAEYGSGVLMIFGIYSIINTFSIIVDNMMLSLAQRKRALLFISVATIFKLSATLFLISWFGILGLALSSIIASLLSIIPSMIVLKNKFQLKYYRFFRALLISSFGSIMMFIIVYILASFIQTSSYFTNFIKTGLFFILGSFVYFVVAYKFNLIPEHIIEKINRRFSK